MFVKSMGEEDKFQLTVSRNVKHRVKWRMDEKKQTHFEKHLSTQVFFFFTGGKGKRRSVITSKMSNISRNRGLISTSEVRYVKFFVRIHSLYLQVRAIRLRTVPPIA